MARLIKSPETSARGPFAWLCMAGAVCEALPPELPPVDRIVVELPQVYEARRVDPDNLIQLAGVNGAVVARVGAWSHQSYLPRLWKGQVPKDRHNELVLAALSDEERGVIEDCAPSLKHNVVDAIGLGLFDLKRIDLHGITQ